MSKLPPKDPRFDADGYPTDETLEKIASFKGKPSLWLDLCAGLWNNTIGSVHDYLSDEELHVVEGDTAEEHMKFTTGGWSGNEDIISAMRKNNPYWGVVWRMSVAGGVHVFKKVIILREYK